MIEDMLLVEVGPLHNALERSSKTLARRSILPDLAHQDLRDSLSLLIFLFLELKEFCNFHRSSRRSHFLILILQALIYFIFLNKPSLKQYKVTMCNLDN